MSTVNRFFISCASAEFRSYRDKLRRLLTRRFAEVKIQEDFTLGPATLLEKLDDYVGGASAVLHLVGKHAGCRATAAETRAILGRHPDFGERLPELETSLRPEACPFTYTQWECYLAIYHRVPCFVFIADEASYRELGWVEDPREIAAQQAHCQRLQSLGHDLAMLSFNDERDVAVAFFRAYDDYAAGATFARATFEPAQLNWPVASSQRPNCLADRGPELDLFRRLLSADSPERLLLFHGPSDRGKSLVLTMLERTAGSLPSIVCGRADFKNGPPLRDVLYDLSQDMSGIAFVRFERELRHSADEPLRRAFLEDLKDTRRPAVLFLDAYEGATDESRRWVEQGLFGLARRFDGLRVIVAGQTVPNVDSSPPWAHLARSHELPPITDPAPWCQYLREVLGVTGVPDDHVATMVKATRGSPRPLGSLLANLQASA